MQGEQDTAAQTQPNVAGRMALAVLAGAGVGVVLSLLLMPAYMLALALGGAMTFGAAAVFLMIFAQSDAEAGGK